MPLKQVGIPTVEAFQEQRIWGLRVKEVVFAGGGNVSKEAGKKNLKQNECCDTTKRDIF